MIVSQRINPNSRIRLGYWHEFIDNRDLGLVSISLLKQAFMIHFAPLVEYLLQMGAVITAPCYKYVMEECNDFFKGLMIKYLPQDCQKILLGAEIPKPSICYAFDPIYVTAGLLTKGVPSTIVKKYKFEGKYIFPEKVTGLPGTWTVPHPSPKPFTKGYKDPTLLDGSICKWRVCVEIDGRKSDYSEWTEPVTFLENGRYRRRVLPQTARIIQRLFRKKRLLILARNIHQD